MARRYLKICFATWETIYGLSILLRSTLSKISCSSYMQESSKMYFEGYSSSLILSISMSLDFSTSTFYLNSISMLSLRFKNPSFLLMREVTQALTTTFFPVLMMFAPSFRKTLFSTKYSFGGMFSLFPLLASFQWD